MNKVYVPSTTTLKLTACSFSALGLLALISSGPIGIIIIVVGIVIFLFQWMAYAAQYQKFIVSDTSLIIKGISDTVQNEIEFKDIHKVFFRAGTVQTQMFLPIDIDVEEISLWMNTGHSIHLNMTPIDNSQELCALLKERVAVTGE